MADYRDRTYLSAIESAKFLSISVEELHNLVRKKSIPATISTSGQMRFSLADLKRHQVTSPRARKQELVKIERTALFEINGTKQRIIVGNSQAMTELADDSIHLMITSPPYFNAKMYTNEPLEGNLGNIHGVDEWFDEIGKVWKDVYRVLQPGRKAFINIMNLPVREEEGGFRCLNLVGRTIDVCERIGFRFKRDIVWHKTNGVRAHFGSYPYPGGILINNMHEFILEFDKPAPKGYNKYGHLTAEQKEKSRIDKEFWLSLKNSDVWLIAPQGSGDNRNHVAPFPYEIPHRLIKAFTYVTETILDPFAGSGTALIAAADLGRNGIGYEIVPEIAQDAVKSLRTYQTKPF